MIARLQRASRVSFALGMWAVLLLLGLRVVAGVVPALSPVGERINDTTFWYVIGVPLVISLCCGIALGICEGIAFFYASYQEGRTLFVNRILGPREAALLARIRQLEEVTRGVAVRDGVLHARGLAISDGRGAPILTLGVTDRGATMLTLVSASGGARFVATAYEGGCSIDLRDPDGRLRFRTGATRDHVWLGLNDGQEDPRAGFVLRGDDPQLMLVRPHGPAAAEDGEMPGYL